MQVEVDLRLRQETGFEVGAASWRLKCRSLMTPYWLNMAPPQYLWVPLGGGCLGWPFSLSSFPTPSFGLALGFDNLNSKIKLEGLY